MKVVFDTSVVLAILNEEKGCSIGEEFMIHALLSVVNLAEVTSVLARHSSEATIQKSIRPFQKAVMPYDEEAAMLTGLLVPKTQFSGLSLGDRACLALGIANKLPVLTADKTWAELNVGVEIRLIR